MQNASVRPWKLVAEGIAIVVSILLAFAIDAWWEDYRERVAENVALKRLKIEFEENLAQLAENRMSHEEALQATEQLLGMTGPEPVLEHISKLALILDVCLSNATYDPRLGTINSLIASGQLQLIQDEELQSMLTEWPPAVEDLIEWQRVEMENAERLLLPITYDYIAWPDIDAELDMSDRPSRFDSDFSGLFSSLRFEGMLANRRYNLRHLISTIEQLEAKTQKVIEKLSIQIR